MRQQELVVEGLIENALRWKYTHLDLTNYQLTTLPKNLASLTNLIELDLDLSLVDDLSILHKIPNLSTVLFLGSSFPRQYWTKISEWQSIWLIDEDRWAIQDLLVKKFGLDRIFTDLVDKITHSFELNLNGYNLFDLPESIGKLKNLTELRISNNNLTALPESIGNLTSLRKLDLSGNQLTSLPDSIASLRNLTKLYLTKNKLEKLPDSIGKIHGLTDLSLGDNNLTTLPESIGDLVNLTGIDIYENQLHEIPESIGNLINLEGPLYLYGNNLTTLPESIGNLVGIDSLFLENNKLTTLPGSIGNLVGTRLLVLDNNTLTILPESIGNITNLAQLCLKENQIESLPKSIANLSNLTYINLTNNPLDDLSILQSLPQLEAVYFFDRLDLPHRYWTKLSEWKPEWLLDEKNVEIRRLLIQICGYERICQELDAIELDTWREYTLLKIDANVDVATMVLLKMTCPSTAHIHILRVPPEMTSAESAITWVNHGIHPDEFAVQT
jgi:leucine-rich repeat protein SHOC2